MKQTSINSLPSGREEISFHLRKAVAQMDLILGSLKEGVVVVGQNGQIVFANEAFGNIIGEQRLFVAGKYIWDVFSIADKIRNSVISLELLSRMNGIHEYQNHTRILILEIVTDHLPNIQEGVFVIRNVTERFAREAELKARTEELETMNKFMVGRELKMVELKEQIEKLNKRIEALQVEMDKFKGK